MPYIAGYGTSPPKTQTGRLLSVFYALFGIPLFLVVLKDGGELINKHITKAVITVEKKPLQDRTAAKCQRKSFERFRICNSAVHSYFGCESLHLS